MSDMSKSKQEGGVGFRTLRDFNIAMLAKQAYRFLIYPNSLVAGTFKAKYYPHYDFLHSKIDNSLGYIWRSIHYNK